ncbi:MAG: hypothetical protein KY455_10105 [Euryarchaeota archaeon]|nr:hypothetical protein [Euryarchaeota archaeon]
MSSKWPAFDYPLPTWGDILEPAMSITDPAEAKAFLDEYVCFLEPRVIPPDQALHVARVNLGYYAGYYDRDTRLRVERLFGAAHPTLGPVRGSDEEEARAAFAAGQALGRGEKVEEDPQA